MDEKTFFILWFFAIGALFGSFINAMAYRTRHRISPIAHSRCEGCGHNIQPWEEIPIISWFILLGRCRHCGARITIRMVATETGMATLYAAAASMFYQDLTRLVILLLGITIIVYIGLTVSQSKGEHT
ncbi:hypothetical protein B1757_13860 [Acidithiobacillus marinus]|uniref:Prepilin peptidase A24 N-terminal domain-containing protein n=1 Tax=Acidithiobacillus marinus TaxID=187490 RepID=A0A2I1DIH8_9PROT|nr:prepilin peptidase [Acidithiobacillus marinus]PKY09684.1 hypothetical protein B1757_13860 [Acidithiobacillus marinus]